MQHSTVPNIDKLKDWVKRCKDEPVSMTDDRYVPLEAADDGTVGVRGRDPMISFVDRIVLSDTPTAQLFSGYIGTGKSTELLRLRRLLEDKNYIVLYADAKSYFDLAHVVGIEELLVILAAAVTDSATKIDPTIKAIPDYWTRLKKLLQAEVKVDPTFKIPSVADLKVSLMHGRPLWLRIRDVLGTSISQLKDDVHRHIAEIAATLLKKNKSQGVVLLFDSLERLRDPDPEKLYQTMQAIVHVLTQYSTFLRLPCHVIYTVSPYAALVPSDFTGRYDGSLQTLPSIKIYERGPDATPCSLGVEAMTRIAEKRIPVAEVFGDRVDLLRALVLASGGHVRTLLQLLSELLNASMRRGLPVSLKDVHYIIGQRREQIEGSIRPEAILLLDAIRRSASLADVSSDELGILALYVDSQTVLCYRNGEGWYEIHPLAREFVARRAAEMRAASDKAPGGSSAGRV